MLEGIWWHCHKSRPEGAVAAPNAEQADPLDAASVTLKSKDGDTVRTSFGIVKQSATIGDATRARGETSDLNQPLEVQLDIKMLRAVIEWCEFHRGDPPLKLNLHPIRRRFAHFYLSDEERRYFDDHYLALWELAAAADYLNVSRLYYANCMTLYCLARSHSWKTQRLIYEMGWGTLGKEITAKCHVVPRNVSVSVYCDVLRFDDDGDESFYTLRRYGGYLTKPVELHSAALPPHLRQARVIAIAGVRVSDVEDRHENEPDFNQYQKCIEKKVLITVRNFPIGTRKIIVDEIGQLSRFALTVLYVHKVDDDHVMASLRRFLMGSTVVACETLNVQHFSPDKQRFLQLVALVGDLLDALRHVEVVK